MVKIAIFDNPNLPNLLSSKIWMSAGNKFLKFPNCATLYSMGKMTEFEVR